MKFHFFKPISLLPLFFILILNACNAQKDITLSGTIEAEQTDIFAEKSGKIVKILKEEGQSIAKGEAVLVTDSETQALVLKQQQAFVDMKKSRYEELANGNRPEQIKQAQAVANAAKAKLDEAKNGIRPEQIIQAEAAVDAAKAKLDELNAGSRPEQIQQAEATVSSAYSAVDIAQANYDLAKEKYQNALNLSETGAISEDSLKDAKNRMDSTNSQLLVTQAQLDSAWAAYDLIKNGPTTQAIDVARANYDSAKAYLDMLKKGSTEEVIRIAQANYDQALAQLEMVKNGNTIQAIAQAKSDYDQALAQLDSTKLALDKYLVKSPSKGVVTQRNVKEGELLNIGTNIGTVSDITDLWVNFYITQKDLGSIKLNQEVNISSKTIKEVKGRIVYISDKAEFTPKNIETNEAKENTVFRFKVKILNNIEKLRAGMTINIRLEGAK